MIFLTHLAFGLLISIFYLNNFSISIPYMNFIGVLLFASILPDIDIGTSFIGKYFQSINFFLEHRGVIHSILFMTVCGLAIGNYVAVGYALPFFIGYTSHLLLDSLTPSGLRPFLPTMIELRGPIKSGGFVDMLLFACLIIGCIVLINTYSDSVVASLMPW